MQDVNAENGIYTVVVAMVNPGCVLPVIEHPASIKSLRDKKIHSSEGTFSRFACLKCTSFYLLSVNPRY